MWKSHGEDNFHLIPQRREKGDGGKMAGDPGLHVVLLGFCLKLGQLVCFDLT